MELALFDLDNTLLSGDSDYEWAQFLIDIGVLERERYEAQNLRYYEQYKAGTLDIHEFLDFQLAPLTRYSRAQLDAWHRDFMAHRIRPIIREKGRVLVATHLARSALCAIVTSTNSFVTAPIAHAFGIDNLIATEPEVIDGRFSGKPAGTPCYREGKVERVEQWLTAREKNWRSFFESRYYADSLNDIPLMERVSRPVAVDPDETLRRTAIERGWEVISLA